MSIGNTIISIDYFVHKNFKKKIIIIIRQREKLLT